MHAFHTLRSVHLGLQECIQCNAFTLLPPRLLQIHDWTAEFWKHKYSRFQARAEGTESLTLLLEQFIPKWNLQTKKPALTKIPFDTFFSIVQRFLTFEETHRRPWVGISEKAEIIGAIKWEVQNTLSTLEAKKKMEEFNAQHNTKITSKKRPQGGSLIKFGKKTPRDKTLLNKPEPITPLSPPSTPAPSPPNTLPTNNALSITKMSHAPIIRHNSVSNISKMTDSAPLSFLSPPASLRSRNQTLDAIPAKPIGLKLTLKPPTNSESAPTSPLARNFPLPKSTSFTPLKSGASSRPPSRPQPALPVSEVDNLKLRISVLEKELRNEREARIKAETELEDLKSQFGSQ